MQLEHKVEQAIASVAAEEQLVLETAQVRREAE